MVFKDYYKILGLETNRVSIEEIKIAYRSEAKKYHPDLNVGNKNAEERIKDINEAYKVLSIPTTRKKYDRKWNTYIGTKNSIFNKNANPKDVLKNMLFGEEVKTSYTTVNKGKAKVGEDVETSIKISIKEAFFGLDKKISQRTPQGKVKTFEISIPKGIKNGERIRLIGQGKLGENGGKPGDLIIKVYIQDDRKFKLNGNNLYTTIKITPWEAALGTRIELQTIDNDITKIYIPKGSQTGETVRINGKGYIKGKEERGDLIAKLAIVMPHTTTKEEEELFKKLMNISKFKPREI